MSPQWRVFGLRFQKLFSYLGVQTYVMVKIHLLLDK
jgi:hypothetical protein